MTTASARRRLPLSTQTVRKLREAGASYADKYRHLGEPVYFPGMEFSSVTRTLARFDADLASRHRRRAAKDCRGAPQSLDGLVLHQLPV